MINIHEIKDNMLHAMIEAHENIGGALRIVVFEIEKKHSGEMHDEYLAHLVTARQTLERQNYEWNLHQNRMALPGKRIETAYAQTDFNKLGDSGRKIDLVNFMGPYFDLRNKKPLIRGRLTNKSMLAYFYFDQEEIAANKVGMNERLAEHERLYPDDNGNFVYALTDPPYDLNLGKDIYQYGAHALALIDYLFTDINELVIYAWDTHCSPIFVDGNEWWGSFFWTIYNPSKNWHIGIIASTTD